MSNELTVLTPPSDPQPTPTYDAHGNLSPESAQVLLTTYKRQRQDVRLGTRLKRQNRLLARDWSWQSRRAFIIPVALAAVVMWITCFRVHTERLNEALIRAVRQHRSSVVAMLLRSGADPNSKDEHRPPPGFLGRMRELTNNATERRNVLSIAAEQRNVGVVKLLLDAGADLRVTYFGETPLMRAAEHGDLQTVQLLLDRGADVVSRDMHGRTALYYAIKGGNGAICRLLLDRGADANTRDEDGATPLMHAALNGSPGILETLLRRGAEVAAVDRDGSTALTWAAYWDERGLAVKILIHAGSDLDAKDHRGCTPLITALQVGNLAAARVLIQCGADPDAKDNDNHTALFWATASTSKHPRESATVISMLPHHGKVHR